MKSLALLLLLAPFSSFAAVESCEVHTGPLPDDSGRYCGLVEMAAAQEAVKSGLQNDISSMIAMESEATCTRSPTQAVRVLEDAGNHGKEVSVLLLTEVRCQSRFFVRNPLHRFPVLVKLWSNHDETKVDVNPRNYLEVKKLYEPN